MARRSSSRRAIRAVRLAVIRLTVIICLASLSLPGPLRGDGDDRPVDAVEKAGGERSADSSPKVEIRVIGDRAWRESDVLLSAALRPPRAATFRWRVSDGHLDREDQRHVTWSTPDRRGRARIEVEATLLGPTARPALTGAIEVELCEPPTAGHVRVPGGVYTIGDTWTDVGAEDFVLTNQNQADKPAHTVRLRPFFIRRDRVTNEEYARFLDRLVDLEVAEVTEWAVLGPHRGGKVPYFRFSWDDIPPAERYVPKLRGAIRWDGDRFVIREGEERHPVVDVTWVGSDAFAQFHGLRLPTNAEWEAAARGRDGRRFPWGDELPTRRHAQVNGWNRDDLFPVGTFSPWGDSPYGVHEMIGGVVEWVGDWYNETYYRDVASDRPVIDPRGPHWGKDHVIRGVDAGFGITGVLGEQPAVTFRYAWFFEFTVGEGIATNNTGFRTASDDYDWRAREEEGRRRVSRAHDASRDEPRLAGTAEPNRENGD